MKLRLLAAVAASITILTAIMGGASALYIDPYLERQEAAHAVAETARAYGYAEDSAIIQAAQADWWAAQTELEKEIDLLARVVYFEAGDNRLSDRHQQLVACVVLNRCESPLFPNTIHDVVYQANPRIQYSCRNRLYTVDKTAIPQRCYDNAWKAARGEVDCPSNVIWQAGFFQGNGLYCKIGNTYFCWS